MVVGGAAMSAAIGSRVRLIHTNDKYTTLKPGDLGTVSFIDDTGTVFVNWDNGSSLGMIETAGDRFEKISGPL